MAKSRRDRGREQREAYARVMKRSEQAPARCETGEVAHEMGECLRCHAAQGEACKGKRT